VFGTPRARVWRTPDEGTQRGLRAAQLQHEIARGLRDAIAVSEWGTVAEFARVHDSLTYDRLRGVLSGDLWMRLDDIAEATHLLGLAVTVSMSPE